MAFPVMKGHGYGLEYQMAEMIHITFLHQFATVDFLIIRHKIEIVRFAEIAHGIPDRCRDVDVSCHSSVQDRRMVMGECVVFTDKFSSGVRTTPL